MSDSLDFKRLQYESSLEKWMVDSRHQLLKRNPMIDFYGDIWNLQNFSNIETTDITFTNAKSDFSDKCDNYIKALRCYMADIIIGINSKSYTRYLLQFRVLRMIPSESIFDINHSSLRAIESSMLKRAQQTPSSADSVLNTLQGLSRVIDMLSKRGVIASLRYRLQNETRSELLILSKNNTAKSRSEKATVLDRKIEALSEAFNYLYENDPRLSIGDRVAIATLGIEMCAPSRVNEILCLSVDDYVTIDDYARRKEGKSSDSLHASHQSLLITSKGSKGAQWSAKPVLNFMIDLFHFCMKVIISHGERSRVLVKWYLQYPDKLYLPSELESLRGNDLTVNDIRIILAAGNPNDYTTLGLAELLMSKEFKDKRFKVDNPKLKQKNGKRNPIIYVYAVRWNDFEQLILERVRNALEDCRRVTALNHYKGDLSKMLFLFDGGKSPCLPNVITYPTLNNRIKAIKSNRSRNYKFEPSLFEKLNITIPVNGVTQFAQIDSHDPRRWLSTLALTHGEKLSNVLINKWARRLNIAQLWNYDFRSDEIKAATSAMPEPLELKELSQGLTSCQKLEDEYGPKVDMVTIHDAGVSGTTMDAISSSTYNRPIARTGEQIIIIYPTWYGFCTHQHHEKPCRAYTSCLPCDNNHIVKGHIPTNDRIRSRARELYSAILNIVEQLVIIHGREIADNQDSLAENIHQLVERGLTPNQMTDELIMRFHEIKHHIKDSVLKNKLHEAFVATGYVEKLDNTTVTAGALIKYHNPTHHSAPGLERAIDAYGGHEKIAREQLAMVKKYPQFAPTSLGLKDQGSLNLFDNDENDEDDFNEQI